MKIHVLYKIDQNPGLRNTIEAPLSVRAELEKLRNELSLAKNEGEKKITLRKIARLERFERLTEESGPNIEAVGKILKGKTSETYLGSDLLSLKKRGVDIASLVLVSEEKVEGDVIGAKIDAGNKFIVNFGVNKGLNANIGAGDILSADITTIRVNGVEGVRRNTPRPGYYAGNKYLPIFDGDSLEIVKKGSLSPEEEKLAETSIEKRWAYLRMSDMIEENSDKPLTDLPEDLELQNKVAGFKNDITTKVRGFARYEDIRKASEFALSKDNFGTIAENIGIQTEDISKVLSIMSAIGIQESSSNYGALGEPINNPKSSHYQDRAIGRYQIMPNNWGSWSMKHFGEILDPKNSEDQDKLAFAQMGSYYMRYSRQGLPFEAIIGEISQDWYGRGRTNQGPTTEKYKDSVLAIYNSLEKKIPA